MFTIFAVVTAATLFGGVFSPAFAVSHENATMAMDEMSTGMDNATMSMDDNMTDMGNATMTMDNMTAN